MPSYEELQREVDELRKKKAKEEFQRKKARGNREKDKVEKVISANKAADAAKKANLDNRISTNMYKQYGAQDISLKQSVIQSVSPKSK